MLLISYPKMRSRWLVCVQRQASPFKSKSIFSGLSSQVDAVISSLCYLYSTKLESERKNENYITKKGGETWWEQNFSERTGRGREGGRGTRNVLWLSSFLLRPFYNFAIDAEAVLLNSFTLLSFKSSWRIGTRTRFVYPTLFHRSLYTSDVFLHIVSVEWCSFCVCGTVGGKAEIERKRERLRSILSLSFRNESVFRLVFQSHSPVRIRIV